MDDIDREILDCLQGDATISKSEIAAKVHLSTTPCWRRIQKLKESGVIRKEVALLDRDVPLVPPTLTTMAPTVRLAIVNVTS